MSKARFGAINGAYGPTLCACGCGRTTRNVEFHSACRVECKCGCGGRARYAYAPGHRPEVECVRCGKTFTPAPEDPGDDRTRCSQCRRHIRDGRPIERDLSLIYNRKMQSLSPEGRRWCSGCETYRLVRFFGWSGEKYYSRCKPCARLQEHARRVRKIYGITPQRYVDIKAAQGGRCAICQIATGASRNLAIDHDHACCPGKTSCGKCVRGLLCASCNKSLGFAHDSVEFYQRAIDYIQDPPARCIPERGEAR